MKKIITAFIIINIVMIGMSLNAYAQRTRYVSLKNCSPGQQFLYDHTNHVGYCGKLPESKFSFKKLDKRQAPQKFVKKDSSRPQSRGTYKYPQRWPQPYVYSNTPVVNNQGIKPTTGRKCKSYIDVNGRPYSFCNKGLTKVSVYTRVIAVTKNYPKKRPMHKRYGKMCRHSGDYGNIRAKEACCKRCMQQGACMMDMSQARPQPISANDRGDITYDIVSYVDVPQQVQSIELPVQYMPKDDSMEKMETGKSYQQPESYQTAYSHK
ncbi:MAG: hypothetical protein GY793_00780 [Proteobacteria bacterium]|nr:hypothetical protein [Pseudomonadota bacterium]